MKKIIFLLLSIFTAFTSFSQDTEVPTVPSNLSLWAFTPRNIAVIWDPSTDNVAVTEYDIYLNGILYDTVPFDGTLSQQYRTYYELSEGTYCFKVLAKDAAGNVSAFSNEECKVVLIPITQSPPTELYLSGILNYAGNGKAIELSNVTNESIDLANYSLKISYDGNTTWSTIYTFPINATINSNETYVIANPNIYMCTSFVNDYNSSITNFDGNDVIGLFKNNIFYDAIGELGNSGTFIAIDVFMKRYFITNEVPSITYQIAEWYIEMNDGTCPGNLGFASYAVLSTEDQELNSFQMYPNPTNGNNVYINTKNNVEISSVRVYDITGKEVLQQANPKNEINVQGLQRGLYILQLQIGNKTINKKLLKQ